MNKFFISLDNPSGWFPRADWPVPASHSQPASAPASGLDMPGTALAPGAWEPATGRYPDPPLKAPRHQPAQPHTIGPASCQDDAGMPKMVRR